MSLHKEILKQAEYYLLMERVTQMQSRGKTIGEICIDLDISMGMMYELLAVADAIDNLRKYRGEQLSLFDEEEN